MVYAVLKPHRTTPHFRGVVYAVLKFRGVVAVCDFDKTAYAVWFAVLTKYRTARTAITPNNTHVFFITEVQIVGVKDHFMRQITIKFYIESVPNSVLVNINRFLGFYFPPT